MTKFLQKSFTVPVGGKAFRDGYSKIKWGPKKAKPGKKKAQK